MSTEDPAWKAELWCQIEDRFPFVRNMVTRDAIREFVTEHIQAAEERGRREALTEAAGKIHALAYAMRSCDGTWDDEFSNEYVGDALRYAAELIEPESA